jgi:hypothetical protein
MAEEQAAQVHIKVGQKYAAWRREQVRMHNNQDPAEAYFKLTKAEGVDSAKDAERNRAVISIPYRP